MRHPASLAVIENPKSNMIKSSNLDKDFSFSEITSSELPMVLTAKERIVESQKLST